MLFIGLATTICAGVGLAALGKPSLLLHDPQLAVHDWLLALSIGSYSLADWLMHLNLPGIALLGMAQQYGLIWAVTFETPSVVTSVRCLCVYIFFISLKTHVWTQICHLLFNLDFSGQQKYSSNKTFQCVMKMIRSLQILMAFGVQVHHWYILKSAMPGVLIDKEWLQVVVFNQQPLLTDLVGAVLILCTIFAITLEKSRNDGAMTAEEEALDASIASQE